MIVLALAAPAVALAPPPAHVVVQDRSVRLGDLVDLSRLAPEARARAARLVVASFPSGHGSMSLPHPALARRISLTAPELGDAVASWGAGSTQVVHEAAPTSVVLPAAGSTVAPRASAGDSYELVARVGPVVVRRTVTALQSAWSGQQLFVRGEDGGVFAVSADEVAR